jgi:hypothetical protein
MSPGSFRQCLRESSGIAHSPSALAFIARSTSAWMLVVSTRLGVLLSVAVGIRISGRRIARGKRLLDGFVECGFSAEPFPLWSWPAVQSGSGFSGHARLANVFRS